MSGLRESGVTIHEIESPRIERSELALVHDPSYIEMVQTFCELGGGDLDRDTVVTRDSWEAALTSAGGVQALIEELEHRSNATGFAVCRPPGHHATRDRAMGFCLFNNVAVTAAWLRARGDRVAIIDWDVHHGNGTQEMAANDPRVLYVSIHQDRFYPFEGHVDDIETGVAKGTLVNVPLPAGTAGDIYLRAWSELVLPVVAQFEPDWVLLSAGYDAHTDDELADFNLVTGDYGWMASSLAQIHPSDRTVAVLEGGYDLKALRDSSRATVLGLGGEGAIQATGLESPPNAVGALDEAAAAIGRHWAI
jgi:acetoin utilization deacetylase AcuC-like enzyme